MAKQDYQTANQTVNTGATSEGQVTILAASPSARRISRVAITSGLNTGFALYVGSVAAANMVDGEFGNAAIAAWQTDLYLPPNTALIARFYSQPQFQDCTVRVRYENLT